MNNMNDLQILILELFREQDRIKLSIQEGTPQEHRSLQYYEERVLNWDWVYQHSSAIFQTVNALNRDGRLAKSCLQELKRLGGILLDEIFSPDMKEQILTSRAQSMIVRIEAGLVEIPWELLYDGERFFCLRWDMGRLVRTQQRVYRTLSKSLELPLQMLLVADPAGNLPSAYQEGLLLRDLLDPEYEKIVSDLLSHQVGAGTIKGKLKECDLLHYAGHVDYLSSKPSESGWLVDDGKVSAGEIIQMAGGQGVPSLVFVNGCQSGRTEMRRTQEDHSQEIFGLANAFLLAGARHYIGTFCDVQDEPSNRFALEFYKRLISGATVGRSVTEARKEIIQEFGDAAIVWASYMLYGDPTSHYFETGKDRLEPEEGQWDYHENLASGTQGTAPLTEGGYELRKPNIPPPIDYSQPQSYTPKFLADKILTGRSSLEGERKHVTALFAEVADHTSLSEKLDAAEVHQIMDGCFRILTAEIHKYEATIIRFTDQGVAALFGAPVAHEDHAQRACYAALSMQKAMTIFSDKVRKEYGMEFHIRVGLNSGSVVVASVGDDLKMDYTAVGDSTNLAARMQNVAKPGTALVSQYTYKTAREFFVFKSLGKVKVEGRRQPVEVFDLIRASDVQTRIDASVAKGLTKFVGRSKEMQVIRKAYNRASSGSGQVLGIVGEAGVGKSRILLELKNIISGEECTYLEGRCLHYGGSMPYLPVLDILRSYFDIKEQVQGHIIKKNIMETLGKLDEEIEETPSPLLELLSLPVEDEKYSQLGAQQKREITFEALRDLLIRVSGRKPLILAIEDLHWIDRTSQEFLDYLIGSLPNTPILLILLYRREYTHPWGSKSYYTQVSLDQLSSRTSAELVHAILEQSPVAPQLRKLILGKAGGNPLFVEELTHSLLENGTISRKDDQYVLSRKPSEIEVPDTIQAIIAARLDRVEGNLKQIMQVASVIGREFGYQVLSTVTGMKQELKSCLLNLQGLEFIYEKQLFPELEYVFKHVLTQEVAYNSMLLKNREEFHEKIAAAMEEIYAERLEEYYELLAYHYLRSQNKEKAVDYLDLASQKAHRGSAMEEAKAYFDQAMELLDALPDSVENEERRISLLVNQGILFMMLLRIPEYFELLTSHKTQADSLENPRLLGAYSSRLAQCEFIFGLFDQAIQTSTRAAELCEDAGNLEDAAYAHTVSQWSHLYQCQFNQAIAFKEDVLRNTSKTFSLVAHVRALTGTAIAHTGFGQWDKAIDEGQEALRIAQEYSDNSMISWAAYILTIIYSGRGDFARATEYGELGIEKAPTLADRVWAQSALCWAWCRAGEPDKGIDFLVTYVEMARASRMMPGQLNGITWLAEAYYLIGEYCKARQTAEELVELADRTGMRMYLGWAQYLLGEIDVESDPAQAAANFEQAIAIFLEDNNENRLAMAYAGYGRLHKHQGRIEEAREYLTKALEIFDRLGTLIEPDRVRRELTELPNKP